LQGELKTKWINHDDALDSEKFTLKGDGENLEPYTLTFEPTAFNGAEAANNDYHVKVRATLTTITNSLIIFMVNPPNN
jgi:hypothetical protein